MRDSRQKFLGAAVCVALLCSSSSAAIGTAFTYQGVLENPPGQVVTDTCAFAFKLCDDPTAACIPGTVSNHPAIEVSFGVFTVADVDFGPGAINGEARWMQISVQCSGDAAPTELSPRVELKPAPYALALPGLRTLENADSPNIIGGHASNSVSPDSVGAVIAGGGSITDGEYLNSVTAVFGTIGGGRKNTVTGEQGTIAGGFSNTAAGARSVVGGGDNNHAGGVHSVVSGGNENSANGMMSVVGGGDKNIGGGFYSMVPGGQLNQADADYSFAAGRRAKVAAGHQGSFAWADSTNEDFESSGPNQFLVRASGGMGINTNAPTATLHIGGTPGLDGIRFPDGSLLLTATPALPEHSHHTLDASDGDPIDAVYVDAEGRVGLGTLTPAEKLDVQGNLVVSGTIASGSLSMDGGARDIVSDSTLSLIAPGGIGIGTSNPTAAIDIAGTPGVDGIRFPDGTLQTTAAGPGAGNSYSLNAVDGDPINAVYVDSVGNVGVGTTAPAHPLDVVGGIHASGAISTGNTIIIDGNTRTITSDQALGLFATDGVGIGTQSPLADLDVAGSARMRTLHIFGGSPLSQPVVGWGSNTSGQITVPSGSFIAIAAGSNHSVGILADGTLAGWGDNQFGQIEVPIGVFKAVAAGSNFSLGLRVDGTLAAWGSNSSGQLNVPVGTFVEIAAGANHGVAIRSDGTLAAWGSNTQGQTLVPIGTFSKISAGAFHNLAIRTNGTIAAWGDNTYGQSTVPPGMFNDVAAGFYFSLAIRDNGTLQGWGNNDTGQINVPSGTYLAVAANGRLSFPQIQGYGVAIRSDNTLAAWGDPSFGLLNVPPDKFTAVAAGAQHALAISSDPNAEIALQLSSDSAVKPGSDRWTIYSDRRLKKNIEPLSGALDQVLKLRGVTFLWRDPASQGGISVTQMGLIADDVQKVFPQWVGRDARGFQTLNVGGFEALTAEAMRELREEKDCEIEDLKSQISELREMIKALSETTQTDSGRQD